MVAAFESLETFMLLTAPARTAMPFFLKPACLSAAVCAFLVADTWATVSQKILADSPRELVVEITTDGLKTWVDKDASRFSIPGASQVNRSGWPDVPAWRFDIVTGSNYPEARVEPLEVELLSKAGQKLPVKPVGTWLTPKQAVYERNASAYAQLSSPKVHWESLGHLRGVGMASGFMPLIWLDAAGLPAGYVKKFRMTLVWSTARNQPASLPNWVTEKALNRQGASWQVDARTTALPRRAARSSVNLSGQLIKLNIGDNDFDQFDEDGFYAVSFNQLVSAGFSHLVGARWENIRLYTGPKDTLPVYMDTLPLVENTLREVPYEKIDRGASGTFDAGDTLKFFAHGTSLWKRSTTQNNPIAWEFSNDPYSLTNAYFIDAGEKSGSAKVLATLTASPAGGAKNSGLTYLRGERDLSTNFCDLSDKLDQEAGYAWQWHWRGDCLRGSTIPTVTFQPGDLNRPHIDALPGYAGDSVYLGFFTYPINSSDVFEPRIQGVANAAFTNWESSRGSWYVLPNGLPAGRLQWDALVWRGFDNRFDGYTVAYRREFKFEGQPFWIFPEAFGMRTAYRISGNGYRVLKVVDGLGETFIVPASDGTFSDSLAADADARYYVFATEKALPNSRLERDEIPTEGTAIRNLTTGDGLQPEYLIITHGDLVPAALQYKAYRADAARALPLRSAVVRVSDIYRQFSGGRVTPVAIRDFLRYALNHWHAGGRLQNPLKHVLILGDGHHDVRGIKSSTQSNAYPNLVPPYEDFTNLRDAICTDDFFVKLDPEDQRWIPERSDPKALIDLAIGRVPVRSNEEALIYLNKVKQYEDPKNAGDWRSRVVLTADDHIQRGAPNDLDPITQGHTNDTERIGDVIQAQDPGVLLEKVYLVDYAMNATGRKPEAAQDLIDFLNRGTLAVNYVGHGAYNQWADEVLLYTNDALPRLRNVGKTTLLNSFSCTVGRFDNLQNDVLTELFVRQATDGAIAGISATRESFPGPNVDLSKAIYRRIFPSDNATTLMPLGMALQNAKNSSETNSDVNDSKYALLGDPAILMRRHKLKVSLLSFPDTLRALDCGKMVGRVEGGSGKGSVRIQILSGSVRKVYELPSPMVTQYQDKRGSILYERTATYENGRFETEYFIPKKIAYGDTTAKIQIFAWDEKQEAEGSVAMLNLHIKGTATNSSCAVDNEKKGPRIRISGCDAEESGNVDLPDQVRMTLPYCFGIQVEDSTGGVVSGEGPDEGTSIEIPGVVEPFRPQPGIDNLYLKSYRYSLGKSELRPGSYLLKVRARDGYGNASMRQMAIEVVQDTLATTVSAYNVPNPMKRQGTTFRFSTLMPADDGEFLPVEGTVRIAYQIKIHNQLGRLVQVLNAAKAEGTFWNGTDAFGNRLANGIYHYVVTATYDPGDGSGKKFLSSKRNTLVISR